MNFAEVRNIANVYFLSCLRAHVKSLFEASGCSYGSRRIKAALLAQDVMVGRYLVRQTMQDLGIRPVWKKAFVRTTDSQYELPIAENLLNQQFNPIQPNQAWVGDIYNHAWVAFRVTK